MIAQAMTANRLTDGAVVYLAADGRWVTDLAGASCVEEDAAVEALQAAAEKAVADRQVVGPYLFAVALNDGQILPLSQRETIRAFGPSINAGPLQTASAA